MTDEKRSSALRIYQSANMISLASGLDQYQDLAAITMSSDNEDAPALRLCNWAMGMAGETGEVMELCKKHVFHGHELDSDKVKKELGDALWYISALASELGLSLGELATSNIDKLRERYQDPNGGASFSSAKSQARSDVDNDSFDFGYNLKPTSDESEKTTSRGRTRKR